MNTSLQLGGVELWQLAGWTMLHFLWVGSLIGLAAAIGRVIVRRAAPSVRYAAALGCLCMLGGSPGGIAAWLVVHGFASSVRPDAPIATDAGFDSKVDATVAAAGNGEALRGSIPQAETPKQSNPRPSRGLLGVVGGSSMEGATLALESCARYLPWLWLIGTPLTFVVLTTGLVGAERLRRASRILADGPIVEACERLQQAMQISHDVAVAICERVATPMLVGIVRPMILLPPSALTGWSIEDIEMVLLHELAHVRRWDNLVNLAQRVIESLLFFHPAVWLLSSWVRHEREACCDAVVVGRTEQPHAYAELLVALAAQMPRSVLFYPAATSAMAAGPLRGRIRRILQLEDDPMLVSGKSFVVLTSSFVVAAGLAMVYLPARGQAKESGHAGVSEVVATGETISVTQSADQDRAKSDSPSGDARLEIKSQDGATIVADMQDGKLRLTADGTSHAAESMVQSSQPAATTHRFPSLEEQKLADLAWKQLGLELEPLDEAYLKQVKAHGFDGGVRVAVVRDQAPNGIWSGDFLVGLHVWPTTSLKDVGDVLNRDDLVELSPLKFYVVRRAHPSKDAFASDSNQDTVVTGRIVVRLDEHRAAQGEGGLRSELSVTPAAKAPPVPVVPPAPPAPIKVAAPPAPAAPAAPEAPIAIAIHPAVETPPAPTPTQVMPAAGAVRVGGKWLGEEIAADPKIAELRQQLMATETELQIKSSGAGGVESESIEKLQKQVAELEQSISEQVQKKKAEFLSGQQSALDNAAKQAAEALAAAQADYERVLLDSSAVRQVDGRPKGDSETNKRIDQAKHRFEERQRAAEDIKRQFEELRREREQDKSGATADADHRFHVIVLYSGSSKPGQPMEAGVKWIEQRPKQFTLTKVDMDTQPEEAKKLTKEFGVKSGPAFLILRDGGEIARREGLSDPLELFGVVRDLANDGVQNQAENDQKEAGDVAAEVKQAAEEARHEMEEAKREAEDERREAEAERREAEQEARQEQEEAQREAEEASREAAQEQRSSEHTELQMQTEQAEQPKRLMQVGPDGNHLITADGQKITMTYAPLQADEAHRNDESRRMLGELKRQLENSDRQMEMMKMQLASLAQQREALAQQAAIVAKQLEESSHLTQPPAPPAWPAQPPQPKSKSKD